MLLSALFFISSTLSFAAPPPFFLPRTHTLAGLRAAVELGAPTAAWGGALLTGGSPSDPSPAALAALRHAARHLRARAPHLPAPIELALRGAGVASANISFSEDGLTPSTVSVTSPHLEGMGWEEVPVLGKVYWVSLGARGGGGGWVQHELVVGQGVPDGDLNVLSHTFGAGEAEASVGVDGAAGESSPPRSLRALSYNVCAFFSFSSLTLFCCASPARQPLPSPPPLTHAAQGTPIPQSGCTATLATGFAPMHFACCTLARLCAAWTRVLLPSKRFAMTQRWVGLALTRRSLATPGGRGSGMARFAQRHHHQRRAASPAPAAPAPAPPPPRPLAASPRRRRRHSQRLQMSPPTPLRQCMPPSQRYPAPCPTPLPWPGEWLLCGLTKLRRLV